MFNCHTLIAYCVCSVFHHDFGFAPFAVCAPRSLPQSQAKVMFPSTGECRDCIGGGKGVNQTFFSLIWWHVNVSILQHRFFFYWIYHYNLIYTEEKIINVWSMLWYSMFKVLWNNLSTDYLSFSMSFQFSYHHKIDISCLYLQTFYI